jgi:hypothetical protein
MAGGTREGILDRTSQESRDSALRTLRIQQGRDSPRISPDGRDPAVAFSRRAARERSPAARRDCTNPQGSVDRNEPLALMSRHPRLPRDFSMIAGTCLEFGGPLLAGSCRLVRTVPGPLNGRSRWGPLDLLSSRKSVATAMQKLEVSTKSEQDP